MIMILLIIYIVGYFVSYRITKDLRDKEDENEWNDVGLSIIISLFSWLAALVLVILIHKPTITFKKPPKWL